MLQRLVRRKHGESFIVFFFGKLRFRTFFSESRFRFAQWDSSSVYGQNECERNVFGDNKCLCFVSQCAIASQQNPIF